MENVKIGSFDDETIREVLKPGTDLRKYSRQVEKELKDIEDKSIKDYIKESENIASLHNQICACDEILGVSTWGTYHGWFVALPTVAISSIAATGPKF